MFHSYTNTIVGNTTLTISQIPSHSHYYDTNATLGTGGRAANSNDNSTYYTNSSRTNLTGGGGSHTHPDVSQSKTSGNTGDGTAVSIVQSYYTVYIWTRTV